MLGRYYDNADAVSTTRAVPTILPPRRGALRAAGGRGSGRLDRLLEQIAGHLVKGVGFGVAAFTNE